MNTFPLTGRTVTLTYDLSANLELLSDDSAMARFRPTLAEAVVGGSEVVQVHLVGPRQFGARRDSSLVGEYLWTPGRAAGATYVPGLVNQIVELARSDASRPAGVPA